MKEKMLMACYLQHCTVGLKSSQKQRMAKRQRVFVKPNMSRGEGAHRPLLAAYLGFPSVALR